MKLRATAAAAVTAAALGMALAPTTALAAGNGGAFKNCTAAYEAGYSNIPKGDPRYGKHLDRDGDGIGCDQPPADFVPAKDRDKDEKDDKGTDNTDNSGSGSDKAATETPAPSGGENLAETGGGNTTPYLAAGAGLVLIAGTGVLVALRKRHADN